MSYQVEIENLTEQPAAVVRAHVAHDGIAAFVGLAFGEVMAAIGRQGREPAGPPFGRYREAADGGWDVEAGFPVSGLSPEGRVEIVTLPGGPTASTTHVGDYGGLGAAYSAVSAWLAEHGEQPSGPPWESYLDEPDVAQPRTLVRFPCQRTGSA